MQGYEKGFCHSLKEIFSASLYGEGKPALAHIAIDVEDKYLYTPEDEAVARKIGTQIAPAFSKLGIINYWVHYQMPKSMGLNPLRRWAGQTSETTPVFNRHVQPHARDRIIAKKETSVVSGSHIHQDLKAAGCEIAVVTGFTAICCVPDSVLDLRALGYKVAVLEDGTDMGDEHECIRRQMKSAGAVVTTSGQFFKALENL